MSGRPTRSRLPADLRHEPFTPRVPRFILERPVALGSVLTGSGVAGSFVIVTTMHRWPAWMLVPSMAIAVLAMAATVIGASILVVLALEPVVEAKQGLGWDDEPLASMGIPRSLQLKCEGLGYWTCEALAEAIDKGRFPWTHLNYDERQQIHRAVQFWRATAAPGT